MKDFFNDGRRSAISKTSFDFAKVILAALFASEFIKSNILIRIAVLCALIVFIIIGIIVCPNFNKGDK